jgi:hypothetical protein
MKIYKQMYSFINYGINFQRWWCNVIEYIGRIRKGKIGYFETNLTEQKMKKKISLRIDCKLDNIIFVQNDVKGIQDKTHADIWLWQKVVSFHRNPFCKLDINLQNNVKHLALYDNIAWIEGKMNLEFHEMHENQFWSIDSQSSHQRERCNLKSIHLQFFQHFQE